MLSSEILSYVTFAYGLSFLAFILYYLFKKDVLNTIGDVILIIAFISQGGAIIIRWIESYHMGWGHVPLTNFYESLIFFSFVLGLIYILFRFWGRLKFLGAFMTPPILLTLAYASLSPEIERGIKPLIPALQSNWLTVHVVTCFLSYAIFAFSFVISILYILQKDEGKRSAKKPGILPPPNTLDELTYRGILVGMPLLTIGIITGSAWAHYAWGSYWSWDPKETWSLITWIIYAVFLHMRLIKGWRGRKAAIFSIIGFASVLFTFLGVNFIISGLHTYL
jgi:cytochrome c-type biogenesis protein CcsB